MQRLGMALLVIGAAVLAGYVAYEIVQALFADDVPLPVSVGIIVVVAGFLLLLIGVGYERWRARQKEDLDEVEP